MTAKAKKAKKAKKADDKNEFLVGWSECGDLSQLTIDYDEKGFASLEAAKKHIDNNVANGNYGSEYTYFVIQVVAKSKTPEKVVW